MSRKNTAADLLRIVGKLYDQPDPLGIDAILDEVTIMTHANHVPRKNVIAIFEALLANLPREMVSRLHVEAVRQEALLDDMLAEWAAEDVKAGAA